MIKCGECVRHDNCWIFDEHKDDNGTCVWAESKSITESSNDVTGLQNDVIKKPRKVRYKLHKPIEYVSIEYDEEETVTDIAHYNEVVYCKDCKHLEVINTQNTYAICHEHDIIFEPFEDSTTTNFCSWGERREK